MRRMLAVLVVAAMALSGAGCATLGFGEADTPVKRMERTLSLLEGATAGLAVAQSLTGVDWMNAAEVAQFAAGFRQANDGLITMAEAAAAARARHVAERNPPPEPPPAE